MAGGSFQEIADLLNSKKTTVYRDYQAILKSWAKQRAEASEHLAIDLRRMETIIQVAWRQMMNGDLAAMDRIIKILAMRADIFSYKTLMMESAEQKATEQAEQQLRSPIDLIGGESVYDMVRDIVTMPDEELDSFVDNMALLGDGVPDGMPENPFVIEVEFSDTITT